MGGHGERKIRCDERVCVRVRRENKAFGCLVVLVRDLDGLSVPQGLIMDAACFSFLFHTHNPEIQTFFHSQIS